MSESSNLCNTQGRAQLCSVSKKRQGLSTKAERERQEVAEEIKYVDDVLYILLYLDTKATQYMRNVQRGCWIFPPRAGWSLIIHVQPWKI